MQNRFSLDIKLQLVFDVMHRLVSRTQCQSQSRDENATHIGQDVPFGLLGSCPSTFVGSLVHSRLTMTLISE
jgi:hypothetical protein